MKFLQMMDFNLEYRYQKSLIPSKDKKLESSEQYIEQFMLDINLKKLKSEIANMDLSSLSLNLTQLYFRIRHKMIPNFNFSEYASQVLGCNITVSESEYGVLINVEALPDFKMNEEAKKGMSL